MDYTGLTDAQKDAILHDYGPCRVTAGAGSGKTKVLTGRIQRLLEDGVNPKNILAITFTKKAAREMNERLENNLGKEKCKDLTVKTFHSFGYQVINYFKWVKNHEKGKLELLFDDDIVQIINSIISPATSILKEPISIDFDANKIKSIISWQKNNLIKSNGKEPLDLTILEAGEGGDIQTVEKDILNIYAAYENAKRKTKKLDMDDLLFTAYEILKSDATTRRHFRDCSKFILIDEFQDTNKAQYEMIRQLTDDKNQNVFIVGDARQAIYSWRGSKVEYILNFEQDWNNTKTIELNNNYRSTIEVVDLSTKLIKNSTIDYPGLCQSGRNIHGDPIYNFMVTDSTQESIAIAEIIDLYVNKLKRTNFSDIAILYRLNMLSRPFEDVFVNYDIPFEVVSKDSFYDIPDVKGFVNYLTLIKDTKNITAFENTINFPNRNIPKDVIADIKNNIEMGSLNITDGIKSYIDENEDMKQSLRNALYDYLFRLEDAMAVAEDRMKTVADVLNSIAKGTNFLELKELDLLRKKSPTEAKNYCDMLQNFFNSCDRYEIVDDFFEHLKKLADAKNNKDENKVKLMSIHASKGLEFGTVFIVGCVNGILPSKRSMQVVNNMIVPESIEEERRLAYVAITRAKERLFLSTYLENGKQCDPSVFYTELMDNMKDITVEVNELINTHGQARGVAK